MNQDNKNEMPGNHSSIYNRTTAWFCIIIGSITGITCFFHGFVEFLQGNIPAIDIGKRIGAITLFQNYLTAGIIVMLLSIGFITWIFLTIKNKILPIGIIIIAALLFTSGGGVAFVPASILVFIVSFSINNQFKNIEKRMSLERIKKYSKYWFPTFGVGLITLISGIAIWLIFVPPWKSSNITIMNYVCWILLLLSFIALISSAYFGFIKDVSLRKNLKS